MFAESGLCPPRHSDGLKIAAGPLQVGEAILRLQLRRASNLLVYPNSWIQCVPAVYSEYAAISTSDVKFKLRYTLLVDLSVCMPMHGRDMPSLFFMVRDGGIWGAWWWVRNFKAV